MAVSSKIACPCRRALSLSSAVLLQAPAPGSKGGPQVTGLLRTATHCCLFRYSEIILSRWKVSSIRVRVQGGTEVTGAPDVCRRMQSTRCSVSYKYRYRLSPRVRPASCARSEPDPPPNRAPQCPGFRKRGPSIELSHCGDRHRSRIARQGRRIASSSKPVVLYDALRLDVNARPARGIPVALRRWPTSSLPTGAVSPARCSSTSVGGA